MKKIIVFALILLYCLTFFSTGLHPIKSFSSSIIVDGITYEYLPDNSYFYSSNKQVDKDLNKKLKVLLSYKQGNEYVYSIKPIVYEDENNKKRDTYTIFYYTLNKNLKSHDGEIFSHNVAQSNWSGDNIRFVLILNKEEQVVKNESLFRKICSAAGVYYDFRRVKLDNTEIKLPEVIDDLLYNKSIINKITSNFIFAQQKAESIFKTSKSRYEEALRLFLTTPTDSDDLKKFNKAQFDYLAKQNIHNTEDLVSAYENFMGVAKNSYLYGKAFRDMGRSNLKFMEKFHPTGIKLSFSVIKLIIELNEQYQVSEQNLELLKSVNNKINKNSINVDSDFKESLSNVINETSNELLRKTDIIKDAAIDTVNEFGLSFTEKEVIKKLSSWAFKRFGPNSIIGHSIAGMGLQIDIGYTVSDVLFGLHDVYNNLEDALFADKIRSQIFNVFKTDYYQLQQTNSTINGNIALNVLDTYTAYVKITSVMDYSLMDMYISSRLLKGLSTIISKIDPSLSSTQDYIDYFKNAYDFYSKEVFVSNYALSKAFEEFSSRTPVPIDTKGNSSSSSNTAVIIDVSGSMGDNWHGGVKIESAKKAALSFFEMLDEENQTGSVNKASLISFSDSANLVSPLVDDFSNIQSLINSLSVGGKTNIGDALQEGESELLNSKEKNKFILLLTDGKDNEGPNNEEIINTIIPKLASENIKVYTIGFGDKGDIDEDLLGKMADGTNGKYYYADDAWELRNVYIKLRHSSMGKIQGEFNGNISQGETKEAGTIQISRGTSELNCTLSWPGSKLDLRLKDPSGKIVDNNYPGAKLFLDSNPVYFIVQRPVSGTWKIDVYGEDVPEGTTKFDVLVSTRSAASPVAPNSGFTNPNTNNVDVGIVIFILLILGIGVAAIVILILVGENKNNMPPSMVLVGIEGVLSGKSFALHKPYIAIGRSPQNDIVLNDTLVSRRHCLITKTPNGYVLSDTNSKNGTFVNGKKISHHTIIKSGDIIKIGRTKFVLR